MEKKKIELLLCIFGGWLGLHHFYNKKIGLGILYLLTVGLFFIGWIYDIIVTIRKFKMNEDINPQNNNNDNINVLNENKINEKKEKRKQARTIVKTMIITNSTDSRKKVGSTVIRGAVGSALLGPVGLVGGAMSGKNKVTNMVTFLIEYADGHRETRNDKSNSLEFKILSNYLEM